MKVCAVQLEPVPGNIEENIKRHLEWITRAEEAHADIVFFPELSLTGYEPTLAAALATTADDARLIVLQHKSDEKGIVIAAGLPVAGAAGVEIAMLIFQPQLPVAVYSKQYLHDDEIPFFTAGRQQLTIDVAGVRIAPAICYESLLTEHAAQAHAKGANLYMASVAKSQKGVDAAMHHYPAIAKQFSLTVIMANSVGTCDNFCSAGQSAAWNSNGIITTRLDRESQGMITLDM